MFKVAKEWYKTLKHQSVDWDSGSFFILEEMLH